MFYISFNNILFFIKIKMLNYYKLNKIITFYYAILETFIFFILSKVYCLEYKHL